MSRLLVLALVVVLSFGAYAGFDAGGGGGKVAISLRNKTVHQDDIELEQADNRALGIQFFREAVQINSQLKELKINTGLISVADPMNRPAQTGTTTDPLLQFKQMADEGDVTVLLIDFKSFAMTPDGELVLKLKDDWGASLKVYQIRQGGEVIEQDSQDALDFKSYNEVETTFSIHMIMDEVVAEPVVNRIAE